MPNDFLSISLILCERVLAEADGVLSAIRIVDVLYVDPAVIGSDAAVQLFILVAAKYPPSASLEHVIEFKLTRPNGETAPIGDPRPIKGEIKIPNVPNGFNAVVQVGIKLKQMGTHYITFMIDDVEVTKTPFTLLPPPVGPTH